MFVRSPVDQGALSAEILFELFDWNLISAPKRMGRCKLTLKEVLDVPEVNKWLKLSPQKEKDEVTGEIRVSAQFRKAHTVNVADNNNSNTRKSFMSSSSGEQELEHEIFTAIKNSDLRKVEQLLEDGNLNINMKDKFGYTPLHSACCIFSDVDDQILGLILKHKGKFVL
jgi:hypothetical protein